MFEKTVVPILVTLGFILAVFYVLKMLRGLVESHIIFEWQRGVRYRDGRFVEIVGPGRHRFWSRGHTLAIIDLRERTIAMSGQDILTKDNLAIKISLSIYYKVTDPALAHRTDDESYNKIYTEAQIALRDQILAHTLEEALGLRDALNSAVTARLEPLAQSLGRSIVRVAVRDVMLTGETKRAYADIFRAQKEGEVALARARGEIASLRALNNAARMLKNNPDLLNLRLIQAVQQGAQKGASVVINTAQSRPGDASPPEDTGETPNRDDPDQK